tara:strand:+ start:26 stop:814 length:789 start_codon:yes stop_codon:yes gene_type:complete
MKKDFKVYPLKMNSDKLGEVNMGGTIPDVPFFKILLGSVRAGKSCLATNLALSPRFYGDQFGCKILISSTAKNDAVLADALEHFDFVFEEYSESLLNELVKMIESDEDADCKYLIVFDDAIEGLIQKRGGKPDAFSRLITRYRHVGNEESEGRLSIILCLQYFKFLTPIIRNNAGSLCLCGSFSQREMNKIAEVYSFLTPDGEEKTFIEQYKKTQKNPYDFAYLNVKQQAFYRNFDELVYKKTFDKDCSCEEKDKKDNMPNE